MYCQQKHRVFPFTALVGYCAPGSTVACVLANGKLYGLYSSVATNRGALPAAGGIVNDNSWTGDL